MLRHIERILWTLGLSALGYCGWFWWQGAYAQASAERELNVALHSARAPKALDEGSLYGRIEIPSLGLRAVIFEGTSDATLTRGVGHLAASAHPGNTGNVVLAAHRDTFFRPLRDISAGDSVLITTTAGSFRYIVQTIDTVSPDAVEVSLPTRQPVLTLITCFPFSYVGSAPERYIVRAVRES